MGVRTNCIVKYYTKETEHVQTYDLEENSDYLLKGLLANGGALFNPSKYGQFSDEEREIMKIYFDPESMTIAEGEESVKSNIQKPQNLKPIWLKIRTQVIKTFQDKIKEDRASMISEFADLNKAITSSNTTKPSLFGKKPAIEIPTPRVHITDYELNNLFFDYRWSLVAISNIIACLNFAVKFDYLVEITANDS